MKPLCPCSLEIQSSKHYFVRCRYYGAFHLTLMNGLNSIYGLLAALQGDELVRTILYRDKKNLIMTKKLLTV